MPVPKRFNLRRWDLSGATINTAHLNALSGHLLYF